MKTFTRLLTLTVLLGLTATSSRATELYLNAFRNPSIGAEIKFRRVSFHAGYYTTIISKNEQGEFEPSGFIRLGETIWPTEYLYASASVLFGLDGKRKDWTGTLFELGGQYQASKTIALRLGVAVIPSKKFGTKVNPTPGVSLRIKL